MDKTYKFITTTFQDTADELIKSGFKLVSKFGNVYTFQNNGNEYLKFDKIKVIPTNILHV